MDILRDSQLCRRAPNCDWMATYVWLWPQQLSGIKDAGGIERLFNCAQDGDAKFALFSRYPWRVIFAHAMMMAQRSTIRQNRFGRRRLD